MFVSMTEEQYRSLDIDALETRQAELVSLADSDVDAAEYQAECERCMAEIAHRNQAIELRKASLAKLDAGAGKVIDRSGAKAQEDDADPFDTPEYRTAFMEYVCRKTPMPEKFTTGVYAQRGNAITLTTDVPVMIPTTISNRIIEKLDEYGEIYARVSKTNLKGGVEYPILDLKPVATWVGETEVSDWQKFTADEKVTFGYYELECRIAQSMLASIVTFDEFQRRFVPLATKAMIQKIEEGIIKGTGSGQMLGILNDTRITADQKVSLTPAEIVDWQQWHKKVKAAIPRAYRDGTFIMAQSTWDKYIETLANDNRTPVSSGYNPVTGVEEYRLMGMPVILVDDTILPDYDDASGVFAIYGKLDDYCINTNSQLQVVQYLDWDVRQHKTVAYMVLDGKILDPYGFVLISKSA